MKVLEYFCLSAEFLDYGVLYTKVLGPDRTNNVTYIY